MSGRAGGDQGQTVGLYIVAVAALFFLAFAFFAVGQASSVRNSAQTAADAAALAAARETRDGIRDDFLDALNAGDLDKLADLLAGNGMDGAGACGAAGTFAAENRAVIDTCDLVSSPSGAKVSLHTEGTVGKSVVHGTENMHARATATGVVEARCAVDEKDGDTVKFTCDEGTLSVDPSADDFDLNLAEFYSVHLSE
ncbi:pilus assembly protein TadG-related protein [Streptomyces sp. MI02-7b]|uniref:pilus assembly protein TadG-related protein n=1 Tax=Streptomyces sp. MI02-7b TaxID=462941 RepID=UPI0029B0B851|nr:pilus assembly protein TadG-related protein [Streptomyces sp. MI02-7b]MDX3072063.1 pilus assembly protein TadG-related protein [Streptomyces sp. MI02-7b]